MKEQKNDPRHEFITNHCRFEEFVPGEGLWEPETTVFSAIFHFTGNVPGSNWISNFLQTIHNAGHPEVKYDPNLFIRKRTLKTANFTYVTPQYSGPGFLGFRIRY